MKIIRRDLETIFQPVADSVANAINEQIYKVSEKKVRINNLDKTSVNVSPHSYSSQKYRDWLSDMNRL